ncbi:hypothetical protein K3495_g11481 [Podosphaera aphanis]|nr:hypothetical protein K3495_g11481 [Podosphaera aphanis]
MEDSFLEMEPRILPRQLQRKFTGVEHLANKPDSDEDLKPPPPEIILETTDKKHEESSSLSELLTQLAPEASSQKLSTPERARSKKIKKNSSSKTQHRFEKTKIECKNIEKLTQENKSSTKDSKSSAQGNRSSIRCKNAFTDNSKKNRGRITRSMTRAAEKTRRTALKKSIISHLKALESSHLDTEDPQMRRTDACSQGRNFEKKKRQESDDGGFDVPRSKYSELYSQCWN